LDLLFFNIFKNIFFSKKSQNHAQVQHYLILEQ
jgi:hypothetical protein